MDLEKIKQYVEQGLISENIHPEDENVRIYNYTPEVQFDRKWDDVTKKNSQYCRKTWKFDTNPEDGALDKDIEGNLRKYHCYEPPISVSCTGVQDGVQEFCA